MNSQNSVEATAAKSRALYILCVAFFPVLLTAALTLAVFASGAVARDDGIGASTQYAEFTHPLAGRTSSDKFELRGILKEIPAGKTLFLAEQSEGRYWPKNQLDSSSISFKRDQYVSPGAGFKYTIVLLAVDEIGRSEIDAWFAHGKKSGKYPGISEITGVNTLAKMRVVRQ